MSQDHRSGCPINLAIEVLGDRWTLLVLRDIMLGQAHFRGLLEGSREGISPSILSDRLSRLTEAGVLRRECCQAHRQKGFFRLTEAGAALVPLIVGLGAWGARFLDGADPDLKEQVRQWQDGGADCCAGMKARLTGTAAPPADPVQNAN